MKKVIFENIKFNLHNAREEKLLRIIENTYNTSKDYYEKKYENVKWIIEHIHIPEINGILTAMYFLDIIKEPENAETFSFYFENDFTGKYLK